MDNQYFLKRHVKRRFAKWNRKNKKHQIHKELPLNIEEALGEYIKKLGDTEGKKIVFTYKKDAGAKFLSAGAYTPGAPDEIWFNSEWAARLLYYDDQSIWNAFSLTVGHELTHKENDFSQRTLCIRDMKFISWVNEVHADYKSALKRAGSSRDKLIASHNYKLKAKNILYRDHNTGSHPSWRKRIYYIKNFDFNRELIDEIARDTKCKNQELINRINDYYDSIILN